MKKKIRLIFIVVICTLIIFNTFTSGKSDDSRAQLAYEPESYDFGTMYTGKTDSTTFDIWNPSCCTLFYELIWDCSWINVFPTSGFVIDEIDTINVDIDTTGLLTGVHTCEILIQTNANDGIFTATVFIIPTIHVGGTGPNNYTAIQDAIDDANIDETIFVHDYSSPYYENIVLDKTLNIVGEDKDTTTIDGNYDGDVVLILSDSVIISSIKIQNSANADAGISIKSDFNLIIDNIITNNDNGIFLDSSSNNIIINNNICLQSNNGIQTKSSTDNKISENNISSNDKFGLFLELSSNKNMLSNNTFSNNNQGNIGISDQSNHNVVQNNLISNSETNGIDINHQSCHNTFSQNIISSNNQKGISIKSSSNYNTIYHNNFIDNTQHAYDECTNSWNDEYPYGGNYWDDYTGVDNYHGPDQDIPGLDGIGDSSYDIAGGSNIDNYPLMFQYGENLPVAHFNYSIVDLTVTCDGSESYDRDGEIISYQWNFGDGKTGTGRIVHHTYVGSGTYTVTLTITDDDSYTDDISQEITIADQSPPDILYIQAIPPIQIPGGHVNISAVVRDNDELENVCLIVRYPDYTEENISIIENRIDDTYFYNQTYEMIGNYYFHIWAVDINGNSANSVLMQFEITIQFIADADGPYFGFEKTPLELTGYAINGIPPYTWHWDFGDGESSTEQNPKHTYENSGNYTVSLTVTDNEGNIADDTTWAMIEDVNFPPLKPVIRGPTNGKPGEVYEYCIDAVDPDNDNLYVKWNWDDGQSTPWIGPYESGTEICQNHNWTEKGTYTIKVTLRDENSATITATLDISLPRKRINRNPILQFLQKHPNICPLLQRLLNRIVFFK